MPTNPWSSLGSVALLAAGVLWMTRSPPIARRPDLYGAVTPDEIEAARGLLYKLASVSDPKVLTAIDVADDAAGRMIRDTLTRAPGFIFDQVVDTAIISAEKLSDVGSKSKLDAIRLQYRRQNIAEAAEGLAAVSNLLRSAPVVRELTNKALNALENKGFLGRSLIANLTGVLAAVAAGATVFKKQLSAADIRLQTKDASLSLNLTGHYNAQVQMANPLWRRQKIELAIEGQVLPTGGGNYQKWTSDRGWVSSGPRPKDAAQPVQQFEVSTPIALKPQGGGAVFSPYYRTDLTQNAHEAGARLQFKFGRHRA